MADEEDSNRDHRDGSTHEESNDDEDFVVQAHLSGTSGAEFFSLQTSHGTTTTTEQEGEQQEGSGDDEEGHAVGDDGNATADADEAGAGAGDEDEDGQAGEGGGDEEEDEDVRTFLEFTGSSDKERARQYLTATEGNLEEAVNLFLSGAPPPAPARSSPSSRQESSGSALLGGAVEVGLPHLLAHLEALASGGGRQAGSGGGDEEDPHLQMDALLSDLTEHDVNLSALARSLMVGSGFSDFVRLTTQSSTPPSSTDSHLNDEDAYESNSTTPAEAKNRLDSLARGQLDAISLVGAHVTRSVASFTTYMDAGLIPAICSALGRIGSDGSIRVLQVVEATVLMLCRGLNDTERMTIGWFIPPRRLGGSARRGRPKTWALDAFRNEIAPKGDLPWLRRLWRRREIDPSVKSAEGNGLLAIATNVRAPLIFLQFLVSHWGCDPNDSSGSALSIAKGFCEAAATKGETDEWASEAVDLFSKPFTAIDEKSLEERRLASYFLPATDQVPSILCSEAQWMELTHALLRFVSRSSNANSARRALEILVLIATECPSKVPLTHVGFVGLVNAGLSPECKDRVVINSALQILNALADAEGTDALLIDLCRGGMIHRIARRSFDEEQCTALAKKACNIISARVSGKCDLDGRPHTVLDAAKALNLHADDAVDLLAKALADITTFEFEQSKLAEAAHAYFSDRSVSAHLLLRPIESSSPASAVSSRKRVAGPSSEDAGTFHVSLPSTDDMVFSFAAGSHRARYRRTNSSSSRGGGDHWKANEPPGSKSPAPRKITILDKLVECGQAILSESVPLAFPQVTHEFPGKEEGVRALLNALPLRLCASSSLKELMADRVSEFSMHTLPLSSRRDVERQVLRCGAIMNRRYLDFCRNLVGRKIALTLTDGSNELHVCTGFDFKHGAHRLKSLASNQQHWRIMSASKYAVLERVFDSDDANEVTAHDESDNECPDDGAVKSAEIPSALFGKDDSLLLMAEEQEMKQLTDAGSVEKPVHGSAVAVWWEGTADLRPGWRLGIVSSDLDADSVEVSFPAAGLFFDDDIRVGSTVRLLASEELSASAPELVPHVGETARVTSIQGLQVSTNGFGGISCNVSYLTKVRDTDDDAVSRKPQVGDTVGVVSVDGTKLDRGILLADDGSKIPFTVKDSATGDTRKCKERDVFCLLDAPVKEAVPSRRVIPITAIGRVNQEHAFAVYIRPGSVASDVPDFAQTTLLQPPHRILYTITSEQDPSSSPLAMASGGWGGDDTDDEESPPASAWVGGVPPPSVPASVTTRLSLGARIEGRYAGKSRWYKGRISRVNADGTYDLAYDDGDTERCVPPAFVAPVTSTESGAAAEEAASSSTRALASPTSGVALDFRKAFPTHAGRALFDALRREDHVLRTEYNFVTRGFEHQPNFYNSFSSTLEHLGAGVFAQFQTYQQADTLYQRCAKFARDSDGNDRVFVRYEPDRRAHPTVMREILAAFAKAEYQRSSSSGGSASSYLSSGSMHVPPKPGSRALLRVGSDAKTRALVEASKTSAWVPATVLACPPESQVVAVCTDDGMFFRRVPADQIKDAPTRAASAQPASTQQPPSRRLTFRSGTTGGRGGSLPPGSPNGPRLDVPVELTRQFSVFGSSNALRHISVGEPSPAATGRPQLPPSPLAPPMLSLSPPAWATTSAPSPLSPPSSLPTRPENQPPKIIVTFEPVFPPQNRAIALIDEDDGCNEDICVFRLVFETLFNDKKHLSKSNVLKAKWNLVSGLKLTWKTKVVFAGETGNETSSPSTSPALAAITPSAGDKKPLFIEGEEKFKASTKDAFQLLITLFKRSQGNANVEWTNQALTAHFRNQFRDPLGVATRVLPRWIQSIPSKAFFLFAERDRIAYLRGCALGVSRSIAWLQEDVTGYQAKKRELAQLTVEISQLFNQAEPNEAKYKRLSQLFEKLDDEVKQIKENKFIGQLRQDLVKVDGANLLKDATALMENHAGERSELIVQFVGDTGAGEGVTHEFYGAVAAELQKVEQNRQIPMWADPSKATRTAEQQPDLIRPLGLFPQPLLPSRTNKRAAEINQAVVDRFRFLGRLMGQALLDEKTVPLPLAVEFFELLKEEDAVASLSLRGASPSPPVATPKKSRVTTSRIVRLIESDDHSFVSDASGTTENADDGESKDNNEIALMDDDGSSAGIVSTLQRLVHVLDDPACSKRMKDAALQQLETRLEELSLRFVDPSQAFQVRPQQFSSSSASNEETQDEESNTATCGAMETEIFDNVPLVDAPYPAVLAFANEWSQKGKTKSQIDKALEHAGHSKIARWRVLQATQATRVATTATNVKDEDRFDPATELIPEGRTIIVDVKNVREYLGAVERHWTGSGLRPQIQAVRLGLADALGETGASAVIKLFPADALARLFCGEQEVKWNDNEPLLGFLLPKGEFTANSREIRMLVECLKKMTQSERSQFLSFCTALPRVPSSGLPQIKIFPPTKSRVTALVLNDDSSSSSSSSSTRQRFQVGDRVRLAPGYENVEDAAHGPLQPGEIGEITNVILRAKVKDWWYHPRALIKVTEGEQAASAAASTTDRENGEEDEEQDEDEDEEEDDDEEHGEGDEEEEEDDEAGSEEDGGGHRSLHAATSSSSLSSPRADGASSAPDSPELQAKRLWFEEGDVVRTAEARGVVSAWDARTNTLHLQEATSNRDFRSGRRMTVTKKNSEAVSPQGNMPASFTIRSVVEQCEVVQSPPFLRPKATTCVMALYLPTGYESADHMLQVFREAFEDAKLGGLQDA